MLHSSKRITLYTSILAITSIAAIAVLSLQLASHRQDSNTNVQAPRVSYIVQAASLDQAMGAVQDVGGEITHQLGIINAVGALLTGEQLDALDTDQQVRT